jgi:hypothetical protein
MSSTSFRPSQCEDRLVLEETSDRHERVIDSSKVPGAPPIAELAGLVPPKLCK